MNKAAAAVDTQADVSSFNGKPQATVNPAIPSSPAACR